MDEEIKIGTVVHVVSRGVFQGFNGTVVWIDGGRMILDWELEGVGNYPMLKDNVIVQGPDSGHFTYEECRLNYCLGTRTEW